MAHSQPEEGGKKLAHNIEASFLNYLRVEKGLSQNTLIAYASDLEKLRAFAETVGKDLLSLERSDLAGFIQRLSKSGLEAKSIGRALVTVRGLI